MSCEEIVRRRNAPQVIDIGVVQPLKPHDQRPHIDQIIQPVLADRCEVCIGIFRGGKFWSDTAQKFAPYISGQRAMKRWT